MEPLAAKGKPKKLMIEATVIRADGRREDLGRISYWHRNPIKRALWRLWHRSFGR